MKIPARLESLHLNGLLDEVVYQLMSGKEAEVFVVRSGDILRCAKIYKDAKNRSFKKKTDYTEGRKVRDSRQARAMSNKSKFGKEEAENEWQQTEVNALAMLSRVGVRVPQTYAYIDGVLLMEMICDANGDPAPRLHEVELSAEKANEYFLVVLRDIVRMLCAGIVHGDLSEFNILLSASGPIIIDFPQSVQATANSALTIFERDVSSVTAYFAKFAPELIETQYAKEIWQIFKNGQLKPDTPLTGKFKVLHAAADLAGIFDAIQGAEEDDEERRGIRKPKYFKD